MAASELKALTVINLPYIEKRYNPGDTVEFSDIEEYCSQALAANPDADTPSAEDVVAEMIEHGSLSEDMDAELHPDHRPVDPNAPNMGSVISQAQFLVEQLESRGEYVPDSLREVANMNAVSTNDTGEGKSATGESNA